MCGVVASCAFAVGILVAWAWSTYQRCAQRKREQEKVIYVPESPQPTRSAKLLSSESHKRMAQSFRARRRGGNRRYGMHRRSVTRVFDPPSENDCGFACVLKAAGQACTMKRIHGLRQKTADRVYMAYIHDEKYGGLSVKDMIAESGHTLAAYLAMLK